MIYSASDLTDWAKRNLHVRPYCGDTMALTVPGVGENCSR